MRHPNRCVNQDHFGYLPLEGGESFPNPFQYHQGVGHIMGTVGHLIFMTIRASGTGRGLEAAQFYPSGLGYGLFF
jgi:hypothetical protein